MTATHIHAPDCPLAGGSTLADVDWQTVADRLCRSTHLTLDYLVGVAGRSEWLSKAHAAFAVLASAAGPAGATAAVQGAAGRVEPARLGAWLYWTARIAVRTLSGQRPTPPTIPAAEWPLAVDHELRGQLGSELYWLAYDHGNRTGRGLVVEVVDHIAGGHGGQTYSIGVVIQTRAGTRYERPGALVRLRRDQPVDRIFEHELAHVLDPRLAERDPEDQERYADALAELLRAHRPRTLAAAAPLLAEAEHRAAAAATRTGEHAPVPRADGHAASGDEGAGDGLPAPGLDSLFAFAALALP